MTDTLTLTVATCRTVAEIDAWLADASAGDLFVYAQGVLAPSRAAGFRHARALFDAGRVTLRQVKADGQWAWQIRATVTAQGGVVAEALRRAGIGAAPELSDAERRVLALCADCWAGGHPLPGNHGIAVGCRTRNAQAAANALAKLKRLGLVVIDYSQGDARRMVAKVAGL